MNENLIKLEIENIESQSSNTCSGNFTAENIKDIDLEDKTIYINKNQIQESEYREFYYQIKGKNGEDQFSMSNWVFPPIFSGKVIAKNKVEAKILIDKEYNKKFPQRVLTKDLNSNEFLLKIEDMTNNSYLQDLFVEHTCIVCSNKFRRIDLYNDINCNTKSIDFCSDLCKHKKFDEEQDERAKNYTGFGENIPVIYKITNKMNGKIYIGQTKQSFTLRWHQHIKWGESNCKFHNAMKDSSLIDWTFEIIEIVDNSENLNNREKYWIEFYNSIENGYNTKF